MQTESSTLISRSTGTALAAHTVHTKGDSCARMYDYGNVAGDVPYQVSVAIQLIRTPPHVSQRAAKDITLCGLHARKFPPSGCARGGSRAVTGWVMPDACVCKTRYLTVRKKAAGQSSTPPCGHSGRVSGRVGPLNVNVNGRGGKTCDL